MKASGPPTLATKLLAKFGSGPHGDALTGDLIEQYRQGRSAFWYWRQALLAILVSLVRDRTRGGLAIAVSLLILVLISVSVAHDPSIFASGLFIMDFSLLLGYGVFSAWVWRQRRTETRQALIAGAQTGVVLGAVLLASHAIEVFAPLASRSAQLVRGAGSVLLMLGLLGAAGSSAWQRTRSIRLSVLAGLWCGALGVLILLSFALTLNLAFEAHVLNWLHEAFVASGMTDGAVFLAKNALQASSEILVRVPLAALLLSFGGSVANAWITTRRRGLAVMAAWVTPVIFAAGAYALWYANYLDRSARPPFVMAGVCIAGIALCGAHPIWSSLSRRAQKVPH